MKLDDADLVARRARLCKHFVCCTLRHAESDEGHAVLAREGVWCVRRQRLRYNLNRLVLEAPRAHERF